MLGRRIVIAASILAVCLLGLGSAYGKKKTDDNFVQDKGVVTFRSGDTLTVKTADGPVTVIVDSDTKVQQPVGIFRKKDMPHDVLIPGLRLSYEGTRDGEKQVKATIITFHSYDLELAEAIQAGSNPTAQAVAANKASINEVAESTEKRFKELGDYEVRGETTVYFATGDYSLSGEDKQKLKSIAQQALPSKAYLLQVKGFADSVGTPADNQVLSRQRAEAVVAYLLQDCGIPVGRIVSPGAMSETHPVASNETEQGRAENRRAEVRLLVNKGIAGGN
jgi:outer membrane protein OmpA-like peptidoglycan-associated protein